MRRAGKDAFIGVLSLPLIVYGGATDGYASAKAVRTGMESGSAMEVLAFPFTFTYHALKHTLYWGIHVVDFCFTPAYGLAEMHPYGPEIRPLDFYQGTWFDVPTKSGTDAQSGEQLPQVERR
jgi:hypothetical protein